MFALTVLITANAKNPHFCAKWALIESASPHSVLFSSFNDINNTANDVWILPLQLHWQQHCHYSLAPTFIIMIFAVSNLWAWLVINVFMFLQRLIYGYISLVVLLLLYSYYFAIFASVAVVCVLPPVHHHHHRHHHRRRILYAQDKQPKQIFTTPHAQKEKLFVHICTLSLPRSCAFALARLSRYERYHIKVFICQSVWVRTH